MRCYFVSVLNIGIFLFSSKISVTLVFVLFAPPLVNPIYNNSHCANDLLYDKYTHLRIEPYTRVRILKYNRSRDIHGRLALCGYLSVTVY